ncbi:hypothetical protein B9T16_14035 [Arthrospira sp. PCC 8006]
MSNRLNSNVVGLLDLVELAITPEQFDEIEEFIAIHEHFLSAEMELLKGIERLLNAKISSHNETESNTQGKDCSEF